MTKKRKKRDSKHWMFGLLPWVIATVGILFVIFGREDDELDEDDSLRTVMVQTDVAA